jgi:hypothetical protein
MPDDAAFTPPPEIDTLDADVALAEARLAMLRRLSELGMMFVERMLDDGRTHQGPRQRGKTRPFSLNGHDYKIKTTS